MRATIFAFLAILFYSLLPTAPAVGEGGHSPFVLDIPSQTYDVVCPKRDNRCDYKTGKRTHVIERASLPRFIPLYRGAETQRCLLEFCYNEDQSVIGLNPEYHLWKPSEP